MRNSSRIVIFSVGFSLLTALVLHLSSGNYIFIPRESSPVNRTAAGVKETDTRIARLVRTSGVVEPGNVEVQILFMNPLNSSKENSLVFRLSFNTLNVDLKNYDITKNAIFEDSRGKKITSGFKWKETHNLGYRHIMGILTVSDPGEQKAIPAGKIKWIKLILNGIPNISKREFRWKLIS
ncbi:MAG: hypothetical protein GXP33_15815 [Spirochaetes bacterium]|nr:hypothetical protein [Spirochaetota bacterium]